MREQFFKKFQEKILEILNWGFLFLLQMAIKNFQEKIFQSFKYRLFFMPLLKIVIFSIGGGSSFFIVTKKKIPEKNFQFFK